MNIIENLKLEKEKGMLLDEAVQWLCDAGTSKVESIVNIVGVYSVTMQEAKTLVHEHKAWSDVKVRDKKFHKNLTDNLD